MSNFVKNLGYFPKKDLEDLGFRRRVLRMSSVDAGTLSRIAHLMIQTMKGDQLWVSKEVSDDLAMSTFDTEEFDVRSLEWPSNYLEVFFEDPKLATFIAARWEVAGFREEISCLLEETIQLDGVPPEGDCWHFQAETPATDISSLANTPEKCAAFAMLGDLMEDQNRAAEAAILAGPLPRGEAEELRSMVLMFIKLLLFISSDVQTVSKTTEKPTRKQGGKPGVRNRPSNGRFVVEYLPLHRAEKKRQAKEEEKKQHHKFRGRRGHFRHFRAERFRAMRGKRKFIFPIPGPDGTVPRKKFVVR